MRQLGVKLNKILILLLLALTATSCQLTSSTQTRTKTSNPDPLPITPAEPNPKMKAWSDFIKFYKNQYALSDVYSKKVDNYGKGYQNLYGLRNFRVVLHGVLYRGGANNTFNENIKRDNHNPLQADGLNNLCKEKFGTAIYFYPTNAESRQKNTTCNVEKSQKNDLQYLQINALEEKNQIALLKLIHEHIVNLDPRPIYGHCWNGWHASGLISTLALMQFCHYNNEQGLTYWLKNTDGNNKTFFKIKERIAKFKPLQDLNIPDELSREICIRPGS